MIKSYLITAWRNIVKNKFYSVLNIIGPAIGIACAILILLYVKDELSFDRHSPDLRTDIPLESDFNISGKPTVAGSWQCQWPRHSRMNILISKPSPVLPGSG
jgi:hypothetical protein